MKKHTLYILFLLLVACDRTILTEKPGFVDKRVFISSERYALYRWDIIEEEKFSLANHIENPLYVCIADLASDKTLDRCDRKRPVKINVQRFPVGTKMDITGFAVTIEYRGLGNYFKGPSPSTFFQVLIDGEEMWLPSYHYQDEVLEP